MTSDPIDQHFILSDSAIKPFHGSLLATTRRARFHSRIGYTLFVYQIADQAGK